MDDIQKEYLGYLRQAESLPKEMIRRGIQFVTPTFEYTKFIVYADGTAEIQMKDQPLLASLGIIPKTTKRIGLKSIGELLYYLTPIESLEKNSPKSLDQISIGEIDRLKTALWFEEECMSRSHKPIEGL